MVGISLLFCLYVTRLWFVCVSGMNKKAFDLDHLLCLYIILTGPLFFPLRADFPSAWSCAVMIGGRRQKVMRLDQGQVCGDGERKDRPAPMTPKSMTGKGGHSCETAYWSVALANGSRYDIRNTKMSAFYWIWREIYHLPQSIFGATPTHEAHTTEELCSLYKTGAMLYHAPS